MSAVRYSLHLTLLLAACLPAGIRSQERNLVEEHTGRSKPIFCYQCNSGTDLDCATLQPNNTNSIHYKPCAEYSEYRGAQPFCRKIVQTIFERDNMVRVVRKCGWEKHPRLNCYYMNNDDHMETVCQCFHDGCNAAPRAALVPATLTLTVAFMLTLTS